MRRSARAASQALDLDGIGLGLQRLGDHPLALVVLAEGQRLGALLEGHGFDVGRGHGDELRLRACARRLGLFVDEQDEDQQAGEDDGQDRGWS